MWYAFPDFGLPAVDQWGFQEYLYGVFIVFTSVFVLYHLIFYLRLVLYRDKPVDITPDPVSVIIASRDDARYLKDFIPLVMAQKNVIFEVIVVDDCSLDETNPLLLEFERRYPNFRHTRLVEQRDFEGGKKYAITLGIKAAKYEHLVFTDADCYPDSEYWLYRMALKLMEKKVVLGYSPYEKRKGFLNKLIRYDAFKIGMNYLSFALAGVPYMGVGRNMAYHSFLYFDSKGFSNHLDLVSGDDDLFINQVATRKNTGVVLDSEAFVYSIPKTSFRLWRFQKERHLTTAPRYRFLHKSLLFLLPFSQYMLNGSIFVLLLMSFKPEAILTIYGMKLLVQAPVQFFAMRKMKALDLFVWSPVLELCLLIFYACITFLKIVKGKQPARKW